MVVWEYPSRMDAYRFTKAVTPEMSESQYPRVFHTNIDCYQFQRIGEVDVTPPGDRLPAEFKRHTGGWCEWCSKRPLNPGEYAEEAEA